MSEYLPSHEEEDPFSRWGRGPVKLPPPISPSELREVWNCLAKKWGIHYE